jgi:epoxide hydrolase-like predicted phosphatase
MIKAVIFDVGGVLIRTADHSSRRDWEKRLGLAEWESEQIVFNSEMGQKAQRGEVETAELWAWIGRHLSLDDPTLAAFQAGFWAGDLLDTELVAFIRRLRPQYQTAIISNATNTLRQMLTTKYPIADAFDLIVVSGEEKVMKPDPAIYELTLERLRRRPEEAVFVDDFAQNIVAAQQVGMATIHFHPDTNVPEELARLGVIV